MIETFNTTLFENDQMVHTRGTINAAVNMFNIVHNVHTVCKL